MGFHSLLGQPTARKTLERALDLGRVHHAYRFVGPDGVGKEYAAFLLAQALVCTAGNPHGCGECSACKRAVHIADESPEVPRHPDVILVGRGLYPSALLGGASEATGISVEQVRRIVLPRVGFPPHEARSLVIIIRDADELTLSAANALLKTLEEPHQGVHFVLLTSKPAKLLDTILSRTLALRFGPLPDEAMHTLLQQEDLPLTLAGIAQGSLGRARALNESGTQSVREEFVTAFDAALAAHHPGAALKFAEARPDARNELLELLEYLATICAKRAREGDQLALWAARHEVVTGATREIERNGSPALVLESMMIRLIDD